MLKILDTRDIEVAADARAHIVSCTDAGRLDLWLARVTTVTTIDDLVV